jgi:hypothetical protein
MFNPRKGSRMKIVIKSGEDVGELYPVKSVALWTGG